MVLLRGPGQGDVGQAAHAADVQPYDLAPTLARLLGLTLPDAVGKSRLLD